MLNLGLCNPAPEPDTLRFTAQLGATSEEIVVPYEQGDVLGEIAFEVRGMLINTFGLQQGEISYAPSPDEERKFFIFATPGLDLHFSESFSSSAVHVDDGNINFNNIQSDFELNIVGVGTKDSLDQTIDIIVLPDRSLPTDPGEIPAGKAGGDRFAVSSQLGLQNTIFLTETAANLHDDLPMVAGHEAGHMLFNRDFPGSHPVDEKGNPDPGHSDKTENLMFPEADEREEYDAHKRLTLDQHIDARCDSAPPTDNLICPDGNDTVNSPLLLPKSKSDQ